MLWLAFEHPQPFVPNIRVQQTKTELSGGTELVRAVTLDSVSFAPPVTVDTGFEFKVQDAILYYNLMDGDTLSLDAGRAARRIDGSAFINSGVRFAEIDFDGSVPMLYARGEWEVLSGFWFGAGGLYVEYKGDSYIDLDGSFGWQSEWGMGAEVGYRYMRMKVEDLGDIDWARLLVDGPYAALNFEF
ncbi:MAG: TIGR04219 family outer membrane beta-barrel protein [Gammaproteobacteria bacterium]|nr:TIGR04219 family outer membrane beta-barrel protein [Gammaproteobacteria bacterium]